jgi:hypothetical protein
MTLFTATLAITSRRKLRQGIWAERRVIQRQRAA